MNFEWMKEHTELAALYGSALEAEKYVLVHPAISAMASRKAMEIVVKTLYQEAVNGEDMPVFVDDMTTTWDFRIIVSDNVVIASLLFPGRCDPWHQWHVDGGWKAHLYRGDHARRDGGLGASSGERRQIHGAVSAPTVATVSGFRHPGQS